MSEHMTLNWIRGAFLIARTEMLCYNRSFARSRYTQSVWILIVLIASLVLGVGGYVIADEVVTAETEVWDVTNLLLGMIFAWLTWQSSTITRRKFEQLNPDFLLTTVSESTAVFGLLLFVCIRIGLLISVPSIGVAIGIALGLQSAFVAVSVIVGIVGLAALAVVLGATIRLGLYLMGRQFTRTGYYKSLIITFGWIPLLLVLILFGDQLISFLTSIDTFESSSAPHFIDLFLFGAGDRVDTDPLRGVGLLLGILTIIPLLGMVTVGIARRLWESDAVGSSQSSLSYSLIEQGWFSRLLGDHIPLPTRTVARHRWLQERRIPRGFFISGFVLVILAFVVVPLGFIMNPLVFTAFVIGILIGTSVCFDPIGNEYRTMPMLLTSIDGPRFVSGIFLAAILPGIVVIGLVILLLGMFAPFVGIIETFAVVIFGIAVCACTASVALATGIGVHYSDYTPAPFLFTNSPVFTEPWRSLLYRLLVTISIVTLVSLPGILGTSLFFFDQGTILGISAVLIRIGSLVMTILLAIKVSWTAYQSATKRFEHYQLSMQ